MLGNHSCANGSRKFAQPMVADGDKPLVARLIGDDREDLAEFANERAMFKFHAPAYLRAWKDAVTLFPSFFVVPAEGIERATTVRSLRPAWHRAVGINDLCPMERSSIGAVWGPIQIYACLLTARMPLFFFLLSS